MTQEGVERLLGRLLTDETFRQRAIDSVAAVVAAEGYSLSQAELGAIRPEDLTLLGTVAVQLDDSIKRFSCEVVLVGQRAKKMQN